MRNSLLLTAALVLGVVAPSCGDDSSDLYRDYCVTICVKAAECASGAAGVTRQSCRLSCRAGAVAGGEVDPDCNASNADVRRCINDFDAMSCDDYQSGNIPSSCDLCGDGGTNTGDTGVGQDSSMSGDANMSDTSMSTGTCADLSACCATLEDVLRQGCETIVTTANDPSCASALTSYQSSGYCS